MVYIHDISKAAARELEQAMAEMQAFGPEGNGKNN